MSVNTSTEGVPTFPGPGGGVPTLMGGGYTYLGLEGGYLPFTCYTVGSIPLAFNFLIVIMQSR